MGNPLKERYLYPVASRLLERCDAVLRIEGSLKAPIRMSSWRRAAGLGKSQPGALIALLWIGVFLLAASVITLGIGLIAART